MVNLQLPKISDEEATNFILTHLRRDDKSKHPFSDGFAFDVYIPDVVFKYLEPQQKEWLQQHPQQGMTSFHMDTVTNSQPLFDGAWNLCIRGILRPGVLSHDDSNHRTFIVGASYSLTTYGREWLGQTNQHECLPTEYKRFSELLTAYEGRYGLAYGVRSQEAVKCYCARTYFACCAMCGAAAESILLALAISKMGEQDALREYQGFNGRHKIRNTLVGKAKIELQNRFDSYLGLLNYWRDSSAHGLVHTIGEEEAFTSLLLLLRFAQLADTEWSNLTANPS